MDPEQAQSLEFICTQLLLMTTLLDFDDEAGRKNLFNLLRTLLIARPIMESTIQCIADLMKRLADDDVGFVE